MATTAREAPTTRSVVRITLTVLGVIGLLYAAYLVRSILVLVLIAAFLAVGLDPAVRRLEGWGMRRGFAVATIFLATILFIVAFSLAVVPPLVGQVTSFALNLPDYIQDLAENNPRIREWVETNDIPTRLREAVNNIPSIIGSSFGSVLGVAGSVLSALFNALTVLVLTIYFLLSLSRIRAGSMRLVPASRRERVGALMEPILQKIGGYIAGQVTVALITGSLSFIFLLIAGVPFPVALALWVTIASLIPLVGATLGAIPAVIVAFFTSFPLGMATLIFFLIYQQLENYMIAPRVMTKAVDVSPAAVLLAALIGGSLLGFVGALMAIPAAASLKLIVQEVVVPRAEKT
ncbi:MAG: AI-2E family transporter [Actinomycetota bacterium]|nr:AI-2E family transporter [Actinomycetota bacterium]